jgi:hypothetical protein
LNGITPTKERLDLLVVDTLGQGVHVFRRWPKGSLKKHGYIELNHKGDNIMYDPASDAYYIGSIGKIDEIIGVVSAVRTGKEAPVEGVKASGGIQKLYRVDGEWKVEDLIMHDGSLLSGISVGVPCCGGEKLILGSFL